MVPPDAVLGPLIRAAALPGVGPVRLADALAGDPVAGLNDLIRTADAALSPAERDRASGWARRALETIRAEGVHVLVPGLTPYPDVLHEVGAPVPLFGRGRLDLLAGPTVAVVGTRSMTPYGRDVAHRIAGGLAAAGVTVVSGLAQGIDGVAHRAAGAARTIGVIGCGIDVAFPKSNLELQEAIGREGLLLTEQLPGTPPTRHNFPRRNRIIAGISQAVVVVEAPVKSGALSTAARGRELGLHVFAVPGPLGARTSEGSNAMIRDGATLVTGGREVLEALGLPVPDEAIDEEARPPHGLEGQALALWRALGTEPRHADDVAARAGLDPRRGLASLLSLEIQGHALQHAGLRFTRVMRAPGAGGTAGAGVRAVEA